MQSPLRLKKYYVSLPRKKGFFQDTVPQRDARYRLGGRGRAGTNSTLYGKFERLRESENEIGPVKPFFSKSGLYIDSTALGTASKLQRWLARRLECLLSQAAS